MSRYDVLKKRVQVEPDSPANVAIQSSGAAKRGNPQYKQFSAYIPVDLYRRIKIRLAQDDRDLSDAVGEALSQWLGQDTR